MTTATITADGTGSGGTGTYTINGGPQTTGLSPVTLNVEIAGCSSPAVFNGNLSLTGLYTYSYWNSWHASIPGSHC